MVDHPTGAPAAGYGAAEDPAATLAAVLSGRWRRPVDVRDLRRLSGGASRETWSFVAVDGDRERPLILQRTRPGPGPGDAPLEIEDALIDAARERGVPVPATVVASTEAGRLGPARVSEAVHGESLGPRIVRAERSDAGRRRLTRALGRALAGIHAIPVEGRLADLEEQDVLVRARDGLDLVGEARPALELALRWLHANRPPTVASTVVHGDFRVGNLLVEGDDLTAVLDWELAHRGDPREDLGWLCVRAWRFGGPHPVGGVGEVDDLLAGYREGGGVAVDRDDLRWWTVAGTLTWALICAVQARRHLDGHVASVELATIGRRVCENEHDLLDLIGVGRAAGPQPTDAGVAGPEGPDHGVDPVVGLHGRPTAVELVGAVRDHLRDRVAPLLEGSDRFSLKVVDRALATVEREVATGPEMAARHRRRLASIGVSDEGELAARIRAGELDADDVGTVVREAVEDRLRVADPRWLASPGT